MFGARKSRSFLVLASVLALAAAGCGNYDNQVQEESGSPADAPPLGMLEPRHGGRIVELTGNYDAELVIMDGGMSYVYLYDAQGAPVEYQGKTVELVVTTPDGKTQTLALEGMGAGAGAHFMNPLNQEMQDAMRAQGSYTADVRVTSPDGEQTGQIEIHMGEQ